MPDGDPIARELPDDLRDWRNDITELWFRVYVAAHKAAALLVAIAIHKLVDYAAGFVIPGDWVWLAKLIEGSFAVAFSIIYLHFTWDILVVFVPGLRRHITKGGDNNVSAAE